MASVPPLILSPDQTDLNSSIVKKKKVLLQLFLCFILLKRYENTAHLSHDNNHSAENVLGVASGFIQPTVAPTQQITAHLQESSQYFFSLHFL